MSNKKIGPATIKQAIVEEALKIKRKKEIFEEVKKLDSELAILSEIGMVGSFGFAHPADRSNQTKNGFVNDQNIVHVTELAKEMAQENPETLKEDVINEIDKLKEEISKLKEENESLKKTK